MGSQLLSNCFLAVGTAGNRTTNMEIKGDDKIKTRKTQRHRCVMRWRKCPNIYQRQGLFYFTPKGKLKF